MSPVKSYMRTILRQVNHLQGQIDDLETQHQQDHQLHLANYEDLDNRLHDQGRVLDNHDDRISGNTLGLENTVERLDAVEESSNQLCRRVDIQEDRLDEYQLRLENVERQMTEIVTWIAWAWVPIHYILCYICCQWRQWW